jgi:hypothetical protein
MLQSRLPSSEHSETNPEYLLRTSAADKISTILIIRQPQLQAAYLQNRNFQQQFPV